MGRSRLALACLLLGLSGCTNPFGSREERQLREAEARWKSHNIADYTFEMRTTCFCPPEMYEWAVVEVRGGLVASARSLTGEALTGFSLTSRKTVDQLFDAVRPPYQDWVGRVDFDFDRDLGYPLRLQLDGKPNIADAGVVYEARSLRR
ncbi:MAG: DUF6174 domain-containing protein [Burkholderiaceae bacterium]